MIQILEKEEKRYSVVYTGYWNGRYFKIDICRDKLIAIEYELLEGQFEDDEIEQLANDILDIN